MAKTTKTKRKLQGWIFFTAWAVLILLGIFVKRVLGHPDLMVFFHLPAAICLVISCHKLSHPYRQKYRESLRLRMKRTADVVPATVKRRD